MALFYSMYLRVGIFVLAVDFFIVFDFLTSVIAGAVGSSFFAADGLFCFKKVEMGVLGVLGSEAL